MAPSGAGTGPGGTVRAVTELTLADGTHVEVRAVEPSDRTLLEAVLEGLSPESRYRRFLTGLDRLSPSQLTRLTTLDHDRQEALVAIDAATGEPIAIARYAAIVDEPEVAELAVAVCDRWQRRGVGGLLLERLARCADEHGITRFRGLMLADNTPMQRLMTSVGPEISRALHHGTVEVVVGVGWDRGQGDNARDSSGARGMRVWPHTSSGA